MDDAFFDSLTPQLATAYLNRFLEIEKQAVDSSCVQAAHDNIALDYSLATLPDCLKWFCGHARIHWTSLPEDEPAWIRKAHPKGLAEFDGDSKTTVLRAGYYLGECFARQPGLRWATGDPNYMGKHMPVVTGFCNSEELPPVVVVGNVFKRILADGKPLAEIDSTVKVWCSLLPNVVN